MSDLEAPASTPNLPAQAGPPAEESPTEGPGHGIGLAEPKANRRRLWWVGGATAVVLVAGGATTWVLTRESPYERCERVIYDAVAGTGEDLANAGLADPITERTRQRWHDGAVETCDSLQEQRRLGEVNDDSALTLWLEAQIR